MLISKEIYQTLEKLKTIISGFAITGSISLRHFGIINRKSNDLDIAVCDREILTTLSKLFEIKVFVDYEVIQYKPDGKNPTILTSDGNGGYNEDEVTENNKLIASNAIARSNQIQFTLDGTKIDVFLVSKEELNSVEAELTWVDENNVFNHLSHSITFPAVSIEAKKRFIRYFESHEDLSESQKESWKKHKEDIVLYNKWILEIQKNVILKTQTVLPVGFKNEPF